MRSLTSHGPQRSNLTYLPILKLTVWYVLTLVKISCFSHNLHNCYDYPLQWMWTLWRYGKREIIYLSLHCHHQNDLH